jgi:hypothetical protein
LSTPVRLPTDQVSLRVAGLWVCVGLFLLRVLGQAEVLLLAPQWLPPMEAWYSGLLSYPILLPVQIMLLMAMSVVAMQETQLVRARLRRPRRWHAAARRFGYLYFLAMLVRLVIQSWRGAEDLLAAGAIPIVFHWVLALFLVLLGRKEAAPLAAREALRAASSMHRANEQLGHERPLEPAQPFARHIGESGATYDRRFDRRRPPGRWQPRKSGK